MSRERQYKTKHRRETPAPNKTFGQSECGGTLNAKQRQSNLELFRIFTMLMIIAHHLVVNSGVASFGGPVYSGGFSRRSIFILLCGAWGKIGINCFVLITGYFMSDSQITLRKFVKLVAEIEFYWIIIYTIFAATGYIQISLSGLLKNILPVTLVKDNFTGCYLLFYLCIPFLNQLLKQLDKQRHIALLLLLLFIYTAMGTLKRITMNYVSWFCVLFILGSYIRKYETKVFDDNRITGVLFIASMCLSMACVIGLYWIGVKMNKDIAYELVTDCNTFLALMTATFAFCFFKNLEIPYTGWINKIAGTTFGVYLIHTSGDHMRSWLWGDLLNIVNNFSHPFLVLYVISCVLGVFVVCSTIDMLRIVIFEKPFMVWCDKKIPSFIRRFESRTVIGRK